MKRVSTALFFGALFLSLACAEFQPGRLPIGNPPLLRYSYASDRISYGDTWKIYVEAEDTEEDMRQFVCRFSQVGYGYYPPSYVAIKNQHRKELRGYLRFLTSAGAGIQGPE